jgi:hypothetical protein
VTVSADNYVSLCEFDERTMLETLSIDMLLKVVMNWLVIVGKLEFGD